MTVAEPVVASVLGILVLGETLRPGEDGWALLIAARRRHGGHHGGTGPQRAAGSSANAAQTTQSAASVRAVLTAIALTLGSVQFPTWPAPPP